MTTVGLEVSNLTVTYEGKPPRTAVSGASFGLAPGSSLALVGASGSGKSSLLLAIAGVIPSTGGLGWSGMDLRPVPTHRREIGVVFQDGQLFPHLTVSQNIAFGLQMKRLPRRQQESRVEDLLHLIGLPGTGARRVTELSGGERQRVALARTLAPEPRLVLLDEPLSSLDAELRARLAVEVRDLLTASGSTWIVVTHDPQEAAVMAERTLTMADGRVVG
jgi:thiamine transport system ATP-binding protein